MKPSRPLYCAVGACLTGAVFIDSQGGLICLAIAASIAALIFDCNEF